MGKYKLYNQNNYANVPYPNKESPAATIKTSGCGVCSMAMILANLAGVSIKIADLAAYSIKNGCRASAGTNMRELAKCIVRDYPELTYSTTNDEAELRRHIEAGGMAIMNADGNAGCKGIFAAGGHYLAIFAVENGKPVIGDPAYTTNRYKTVYRKQYVTELGGSLITCAWSTLDLDTKYRSPNYYLFKNIAVKAAENEEDENMYETINDVPEAYRDTIQDLIDLKVLRGEGKKSDGTLILNINETFCKCAAVFSRREEMYETIEDVPESYRPSVQKLIDKKVLKGEGKKDDDTLILNISEDFCKQVTINDRTGLYD